MNCRYTSFKKYLVKYSIIAPPPFKSKTLIAVGSLLSAETLSRNALIWGTGTLTTKSLYKRCNRGHFRLFPLNRSIDYIKEKLRKTEQPDIRAVRGPRTQALLQNLGFACPSVFGDPAILMPRLYTPHTLNKKINIGLILHHSQELSTDFQEQLLSYGIQTISILRSNFAEIENFIDEISSCNLIFSTSLHGIIISQAYGIPAQWIRLHNRPIHTDDWHKFEDYFLGAGQIVQKALEIKLDKTCIKTILNASVPDILPFRTSDQLLEAFPKDSLHIA